MVTPGATALPASASALAAILLASRIFSMVSGVCTHGSCPSFAVGFHTYSGRSMESGTGSVGDSVPGFRGARTVMASSLEPAATPSGPAHPAKVTAGNTS